MANGERRHQLRVQQLLEIGKSMNTTPTIKKTEIRGFGLMELMVAIFVLAVGLLGGMMMVIMGMSRDNSNRVDTTATNVAQTVLEQIAGAPANSNPTLTVTDCIPNTLNINTAPGGAGAESQWRRRFLRQYRRLSEREQLPDDLHALRHKRVANAV